jgi:LPXTG-motif cell wall-anchored protein
MDALGEENGGFWSGLTNAALFPLRVVASAVDTVMTTPVKVSRDYIYGKPPASKAERATTNPVLTDAQRRAIIAQHNAMILQQAVGAPFQPVQPDFTDTAPDGSPVIAPEPSKMNPLLVVGGLALVGVIGYSIYKKKKRK